MTRPAEELLEFGRLRELLRGQTTSALGGRAVDALAFGTDRARLEREFAAIAEAVAWLRQGSEMGFGALADPAGWFERLVEARRGAGARANCWTWPRLPTPPPGCARLFARRRRNFLC